MTRNLKITPDRMKYINKDNLIVQIEFKQYRQSFKKTFPLTLIYKKDMKSQSIKKKNVDRFSPLGVEDTKKFDKKCRQIRLK